MQRKTEPQDPGLERMNLANANDEEDYADAAGGSK